MFKVFSRKFISTATWAIVGAGLLMMTATGGAEAAICGEYTKIKDMLAERYQEVPKSVGMIADKGVIQVFLSQEGTWSILLTSTDGRACIVAAGHSWQDVKQILTGAPA
ncbi:MAG: hypothetical protein ACC634_03560 [Hyphomicrobiales bacterium]